MSDGRRWHLGPRQQRPVATQARRRLHVTFMKYVLFGASLALVAAIVIWPQVAERQNGQAIDFAEVARTTPKSTMTNARFVGGEDQNLNVTADRVVQDANQSAIVHLTTPEGDTTTDGGTWLHLSAESGIYNRETAELELNGSVALFTDEGNEVHSATATFRLNQGEVDGGGPVTGHGPYGRFKSDTFSIREEGNVLFLRGNVRVIIEPGGTR